MSRSKPWEDTERGRDADVAAAFGAELRARRLAAGRTQADLAEAAGLHEGSVSLLELGKRQPSLGVAFRLSQALGLSRLALPAAASDRMDGADT